MSNIFKLNQVVSKNKYNKGIATTQRFDVVDLGKPGADDWFKLYTFTEQGLDNFPARYDIAKPKILRVN